MGALSKLEIANTLTDNPNLLLNKRDAKEVVENFFEEIAKELAKPGDVTIKIAKWGNYCTIKKNPRPGRNPKTGEEVTITPRRVVSFRAGQKLKETISGEVTTLTHDE